MFSSARFADASGKALSPGLKVQCFEKNANGELRPNVRRGVGAVHKLTSKGVLVKERRRRRPPPPSRASSLLPRPARARPPPPSLCPRGARVV